MPLGLNQRGEDGFYVPMEAPEEVHSLGFMGLNAVYLEGDYDSHRAHRR